MRFQEIVRGREGRRQGDSQPHLDIVDAESGGLLPDLPQQRVADAIVIGVEAAVAKKGLVRRKLPMNGERKW